MTQVVGVSFRQPGKQYFFDPAGLTLSCGDLVIVKTSKGLECGEIVQEAIEVEDEEIVSPLKKIIRRANAEDQAAYQENQDKEKDAFKKAQEKIAEHKLDMRLVNVELLFDRSKMVFYFTADARVDFRELVKDLATTFKTRIELRQIGVRDKAKMVGGLGHCGQRLCCTVFLSDLDPVSIRMAKEQNLPLNPLKISGVCGRLMCCLRYEFEAYKDFNKRAPKPGSVIETTTGEGGKVVELNVLREQVTVQDKEGRLLDFPLAEIKCTSCETCAEEVEVNGRQLDEMDAELEEI